MNDTVYVMKEDKGVFYRVIRFYENGDVLIANQEDKFERIPIDELTLHHMSNDSSYLHSLKTWDSWDI